MSRSLDTQIDDALELLLYAERYRNTLVVLVLDLGVNIRSVLDALRVFELAHIRGAVFCADDPQLAEELSTLSRRGIQLQYTPLSEAGGTAVEIREDVIPVFAIAGNPTLKTLAQRSFEQQSTLTANKVFLCLNPLSPLLEIEKALLSAHELSHLQHSLPEYRELFQCLHHELVQSEREIVLLKGTSSDLFQEVFTFLGAGTMLTSSPPNRARPAELSDVLAIAQLRKPYALDGTLLPLDEDAIAKRVNEFLVYTVHDAVVGVARLTPYGPVGELGSICTIPRYRGKGLARDVAQAIFEAARARGMESVFALSTSSAMWQFFTSLGMEEVPRESLPEEWQVHYSFERPSKAYLKRL